MQIPKTTAWLLGGITFISLSYFLYTWYSAPKSLKDEPAARKSTGDASNKAKQIEVEDVDGSESEDSDSESEESEEEEDNDPEEEPNENEKQDKDEQTQLNMKSETAENSNQQNPTNTEQKPVDSSAEEDPIALKERYDAAIRLGTKFTQGGFNDKAVEKYTEALNLAPKVPSAQKDILTLYNNRSAVYEKLGQFDSSLRDIGLVLAMDPFHVKARVRRARVYESQGKIKESLQDYVHATVLERLRQQQPAHDRKITELSKRLAVEQTPKKLKELRAASLESKKPFPSKSYCRNFFEAYPSSYAWKSQFYGASRESLVAAVEKAKSQYQENPSQAVQDLYQSTLDLIKYDFSHDAYKKAFEAVRSLPAVSLSEENQVESLSFRSLLSLYHELIGTEAHLLFQIDAALKEFERAVELMPKNIDAQLKLCSLLLENGEREKALEFYARLLLLLQEQSDDGELVNASGDDAKSDSDSFADARSSPIVSPRLESESKELKTAYRAWVYNHRASLWVSRDDNGLYSPDAFSKAIADVEKTIAESGDVMQLPEGKGAHFTALLKSCQLRTHTKQAMEVPTTEEDYAQIRMAIQSAKSLFPDHESVLLLEVEQIVNEGDMDTAIKVVEKASRSGNYDEFIILNLKATINTNLAFMALNQGDQAGAQAHLVEVNQCYDKALLLDPESLEVKAQFAQMKSLFGDFDGASKLYNEALSIARSKDEVIDLLSMLLNNDAQVATIAEIQRANQ